LTRTYCFWAAATLAVSIGFGRLAGHNLANYGPWSNDEGELIAVGYKLATQGILGSDMYTGFFGADQHFLETLPLQDILQAISFHILGPGITQARIVSVLAGLSIIWVTGWLALRWYGLAAALTSELLLIAWRSNLTATPNGLPLLGVARTARYDVLAVAAAWLAIAALDASLRKPTPLRAMLTGVCGGLAALSQFFGIFVLPLTLIGWHTNRTQLCRTPISRWIVLGFVLSTTPYVVYAARYTSDLVGQFGVFGKRGNFLAAGYVPNNVITEPMRYAHLVSGWPPTLDAFSVRLSDNPVSPWLLLLGFWPALAYVAWRARRRGAIGDRLLMCSAACFGGLLCLLDQAKTPLYAILLLPTVCVCVSAGGVALVSSTWRRWRQLWARTIVVTSLVALCGAVALEGIDALAAEWTEATAVTPYIPLGELIDASIAPGSPVLGPERWWWALRSHPYTSLRSIWFQWTARQDAGETPEFADWVIRARPDSIIVNINVRNDVRAFPPQLQDQFWTFLDRCTVLVKDIPNPNYFEIEVYKVTDACR
jgi:4-amino-4-deoxy-L-arabinose transferase-like glycosyltransferase